MAHARTTPAKRLSRAAARRCWAVSDGTLMCAPVAGVPHTTKDFFRTSAGRTESLEQFHEVGRRQVNDRTLAPVGDVIEQDGGALEAGAHAAHIIDATVHQPLVEELLKRLQGWLTG